MKLSILTTLYQSAPYIKEFLQRASAVARKHFGDDYELVFVNDGSPDNSLDIVVDLAEQDSHIVVVDLSRNFGHHKAIMAGLAYCDGDLTFLIDVDLEEDPEWLADYIAVMEREQCDLVYGVQTQRKGGWFERWSGKLFYKLMRLLGELPRPENWVTASLMTLKYVDALLMHEERELDLGGIFVITGFKQHECRVLKHSHSPTTYTPLKKIELLVNAVTSFTATPLIIIFYFGAILSFLSSIFVLYLAILWLSFEPPPGWTSVLASIWLLSGIVILFLGVIGIYLSKVFAETKRRPLVIIKDVYTKSRKKLKPSRP